MTIRDPLSNWSQPASFTKWGEESSPPIEIPWLAYLGFHVHPDVVVAVGRLLFPNVVEHEGGIFLEINFSEDGYKRWRRELVDIHETESMMNHLHVYDVFSTAEQVDEISFKAVANLIAQTWRWALKIACPDRKFLVTVSNSESDYGPTVSFCTVPSPQAAPS